MATAAWKGNIGFGLITVPVKLYTAARREGTDLHLLHKADNSRLRQVFYCAAENTPVFAPEIVKGFEYSKGKYATLSEQELESIAPKTTQRAEIVEFIHVGDVSPIYFESSFYLAPRSGAGEKP